MLTLAGLNKVCEIRVLSVHEGGGGWHPGILLSFSTITLAPFSHVVTGPMTAKALNGNKHVKFCHSVQHLYMYDYPFVQNYL